MAVPILNENILEVSNLEVVYKNSVIAFRGISLEVPQRGFVTVLGANGAGKTSLIRATTGLLFVHDGVIREGEIILDGKPAHKMNSTQVVRSGVSQVPEGRMLFPTLTVEENLLMGAMTRKDRAAIAEDLEQMYETLPTVIVDRRKQEARWLSGGEQQMVAVGRALMAKPRLLICDELSLGLAPQIVESLFNLLVGLNRDEGLAILMIEQNARMALEHANYGYILETGRVMLDGPAAQLRENEDVKEFYLGGHDEASQAYATVKHYKKQKKWLA